MKMLLYVLLLMMAAGPARTEEADDPPPPLKRMSLRPEGARPGWLMLSDETVLQGAISTTRGKPLTVFNREEKEYARLAWNEIARIDVVVEKDVLERDWRWAEGGSDVKVFTDLYYVWHKYLTTISLKDGAQITGDISAPLYIETVGEDPRRLILHRRNKGEKAQEEEEAAPVYIRKLVLTDVEDAEQPPPPDEVEKEEKEKDEEKKGDKEEDEE